MKRTLTVLLIVLMSGWVIWFSVSCKRNQETAPPNPSAQVNRSAAPQPPQDLVKPEAPSAKELREMVLAQIERSQTVQAEINALGRPNERDSEQVRQILLRRKGELLVAQKKIKLSDQLIPSQKDSLLKLLENESIKVSTQLMTVSG